MIRGSRFILYQYEKISFSLRSRHLKYVFCLSSAEAKNTAIRTSVRTGGEADSECMQCGCSAEKPQRGFFDGLTAQTVLLE